MARTGIPRGSDPSFAERAREAIEILQGNRGDPLDAAVTYRDLIQTGIALPSRRRGARGSAQVEPGQNADRSPPPKPLNPAISDGFSQATLTWDIPPYGNHSFTEIWRASTNDLSAATRFAIAGRGLVGIFSAPLSYGETWYYWIRFVSTAGVEGPWHSDQGLESVGPENVKAVLDGLAESIDFSYLSSGVNSELNEIPSLQSQVNQLQNSIAATVFVQDAAPVPGVGEAPDPIPANARWYDSNDGNAPYIWNYDSVRNASFGWTVVSGTGHYRLEIAAGGAPGIAEPASLILFDGSAESTLTRAANDTTALNAGEWSWVNDAGLGGLTIYVRLPDDSDPDLLTVDYLRAYRWKSLLDPRVGANESAITALDVRITDAESNISAQASAISALDTTVTNLDGEVSANATAITTLQTEVDGNTASVTSLSSSVNGLEARQGVRLNVNGYVTGYVQNNDGQQGDFAILADRFVVLDPANGGQSPVAPFAVVGGIVYIDTARIRDGSIANAKIGTLSADKITTGTMSADRLFGGSISGNEISVINLSASNIVTGTLNTSRINLDGLTLTNSGGLLSVKNGGIETEKLAGAAVSDTFINETTSNNYVPANNWNVIATVGGFWLEAGSTSQIFFTLLTEGEASGPPTADVRVRRFKQVSGSWSLDETVFSHGRRLNQDFLTVQTADTIPGYAYYYYDVSFRSDKNKYVYAGSTLSVTTLKR